MGREGGGEKNQPFIHVIILFEFPISSCLFSFHQTYLWFAITSLLSLPFSKTDPPILRLGVRALVTWITGTVFFLNLKKKHSSICFGFHLSFLFQFTHTTILFPSPISHCKGISFGGKERGKSLKMNIFPWITRHVHKREVDPPPYIYNVFL